MRSPEDGHIGTEAGRLGNPATEVLQVWFAPWMTVEINTSVFLVLTVLIFRATSERLEGESVTQALKRFEELQQLELPLLMAMRAKGCRGSEVLLFSVTPRRLILSMEPVMHTVLY